MARFYSRKKGKSGSKKPLQDRKLTWIRYKKKEVEILVIKLAKEGHSQSKIGLILRDTYGVPDVKSITGKRISQILKDRNQQSEIPEDLLSLMRKYVAVKKHIEDNHKDETAKRGLELTNSKIKRLVKYYKKSGRLAADWKYNPENIRMYVE
ncbi:MAG: 30S ribosomal protein S15 [Candidatus Woesearchaeota archaeon]|nr:30S ribosomal protein S15 [Candidatus Woesearchaeota archaeon]